MTNFFYFANIIYMKKKFISYTLLFLFVFCLGFGVKANCVQTSFAAATPTLNKQFEQSFSEPQTLITCTYTTYAELNGTIDLTFSLEKDEEKLEKFHKVCRKQIDSADIGFVFYQETTYSADSKLPIGEYRYKVKLPDNLAKKDLAVIPFSDYRTAKKLLAVEATEDGYISFRTSEDTYAVAIVYNGVYKDLILIGIILLVVLTICVLVKVYCVRKDNPYIQDKKKEKAIKKAKEAHHQNRILAKAAKRQKEEIRKQKNG